MVVLCTGGYGNVFYLSTNAKGCNVTANCSEDEECLTTLAATLREVFPKLAALPGGEILLIAGGPEAELGLDLDHKNIACGL